MKTLESALLLDLQGNVQGAIAAYEEAIVTHTIDEAGYANLIVIYMQCLDYGFSTEHGLSDDDISKADCRLWELRMESKSLLGESYEILFWEQYARCVILGEDFLQVIPYWVDWVQAGYLLSPLICSELQLQLRFKDKLDELRLLVDRPATERERYMAS